MLPVIGKSGSLKSMRNYMRQDCNMLQIIAGKTPDDDDYLIFVCKAAEYYAVLQSPSNSRDYTVIVGGDIMFMHEKNLMELAENLS